MQKFNSKFTCCTHVTSIGQSVKSNRFLVEIPICQLHTVQYSIACRQIVPLNQWKRQDNTKL